MKRRGRGVPRGYQLIPAPDFSAAYVDGRVGFGTVVGVIDSGCARISTVRKSIRPEDMRDFSNSSEACEDLRDHGTHVISVIKQLAPGVRIVLARVDSGYNNSIRSFEVVKALDWLAQKRVNVVNLSLGFPPSQFCGSVRCGVERAVKSLTEEEIVVVAAAGNRDQWSEAVRCPAVSEDVIAVGAIDEAGKVAEYSVGAMGKPNILTTGTIRDPAGNTHRGTSFAAPIVAAAISILGGTGQMSYRRAAELLVETARPIPGQAVGGVMDLRSAWEVGSHGRTAGRAE